MNFREILDLKDKTAILKMAGKVVGVYDKKPTDKQKSAGIHPQDIVLQDEEGTKLRACIMNEGMHLPKDAVGRRFIFESIPNEKGQPSGVFKNVYQNLHSVQLYRDAVITGDKAVKQEAPEKPTPKRVEEVSMEPKGRADIDDHVAAITDLVLKIHDNLSESSISKNGGYDDMAVRLGTTVYIQICKEGLIKRRPRVPDSVVQMASPSLHKEAEVLAETNPEPDKNPVPRVSPDFLVGKALSGELSAKEIEEYHDLYTYDWEKIYDQLEQKLKEQGFKPDDIGTAYDEAKAAFVRHTKKFDNASFCRAILSGIDTFKGSIEAAATKRDESPPKEAKGKNGKQVYREPVEYDSEIPF